MDTATNQRIGIYSGSFDPVHSGHIGLAIAAQKRARLDQVYFLPEPTPRRRGRGAVTHIHHRVAMLEKALQPYPSFHVLTLPDKQFTPAQSLPRLEQRFKTRELFLILGSDTLEHLSDWPQVQYLLERMSLIVGVRSEQTTIQVNKQLKQLTPPPKTSYVITSPKPKLSSRQLRDKLYHGQKPSGVLPSLKGYIREHWLYASPSASDGTESSSSNSDS